MEKKLKAVQSHQDKHFVPRVTYIAYSVSWACNKIGENWRASQVMGK